MKPSKTLIRLSLLIIVLAAIAASLGLFWQNGGHVFFFISLRDQVVQIYGQGLYSHDSTTFAIQEKGQDIVTLFLGIPLLALSLLFYRWGSLRGHLLLAGTLGYFLYTYASMAFLTAYNPLFLVYVALFSASLFAFVLALTSCNLRTLSARFSSHLPRRTIAGFLFTVGLFLLTMWLGLIVPPLFQGKAPEAMENTTTLVIQALDLGIIVPAVFLSGTLLLKGTPLGYLLASVILIKFLTLGATISAMVVVQLLFGISMNIAMVIGFPLLTLIGMSMTITLLHNLTDIEKPSTIHSLLERKIVHI